VENIDGAYEFGLDDGDPMQIDARPLIRAIVDDVESGCAAGVIASRFHNTVAEIVAEVCGRIRHRDRLNRVCLSGGVFQNMYLLEGTVRRLRAIGFEVYLHATVPPNDGGIALGQAMIANEILQGGA
jgi:hydrogenase maturation protein HypF